MPAPILARKDLPDYTVADLPLPSVVPPKPRTPIVAADIYPVAPVKTQPAGFNDALLSKGDSIAMDEIYLPGPLTPEQAVQWQDLPPEHLQDADMWLHRTEMKAMYGISERS